MTPLQIQMMLHYYVKAEAYAYREPEHAASQAVRSQRSELITWNMLEVTPDRPAGYTPTDKGEAYIEALCAMPLPIKKWIMPDAV